MHIDFLTIDGQRAARRCDAPALFGDFLAECLG